jgi:putative transposase
MEGELFTQLGYDKHEQRGSNRGNSRNGFSKKALKCESGEINIQVPRDRNGDFSPQIVPKRQTRFDGFDNETIRFYRRGMSTRDTENQLKDLYGVDISPTIIANLINEVIAEVKAGQSRPLDMGIPHRLPGCFGY